MGFRYSYKLSFKSNFGLFISTAKHYYYYSKVLNPDYLEFGTLSSRIGRKTRLGCSYEFFSSKWISLEPYLGLAWRTGFYESWFVEQNGVGGHWTDHDMNGIGWLIGLQTNINFLKRFSFGISADYNQHSGEFGKNQLIISTSIGLKLDRYDSE